MITGHLMAPDTLRAHARGCRASQVDAPLSEGDFFDVWPGSCLNGWTMGNLAASPTYYLLPTTYYLLLATHYSLLTTHYSLLATHYSLIATH